MRSYFESLEKDLLSPLAVKSYDSKGRQYSEDLCDYRTCFERDRDRIIHSKSFRRLKDKTQVFVASQSDHYRSRMTHTFEVTQLSRHLARLLRLNEPLSECIALAHDLGHPPFGHSGEDTLNELMSSYGGFEHNIQSLRIVDTLEKRYPFFPGLNLSFEVREGLRKHTTPWDNPDSGDDLFVTLESQVANLADEIAYNNHDIIDGLSSKILSLSQLENHVPLWNEATSYIRHKYSNLTAKEMVYLVNSHLISTQVMNVVETTNDSLVKAEVFTLEDLQHKPQHYVSFSKDFREQTSHLRKFLYDFLYTHPTVTDMNKKGQDIIRFLFSTYTNQPKNLPLKYENAVSSTYPLQRVCADYISGMTDIFATAESSRFS